MERDVPTGSVFNVGAGASISLLELYRAMAQELGSDLEPLFAPAREGDVRDSLASLERARTVLGYEPAVHWRDGLRETLAWYRSRAALAR